jgi:phenylpropionate dioxygenase-like ring-hydroxylating dioxygenase large terminal subunit
MGIVDRALLQSVTLPVAHATGLPNAFYTSPEVYALERDKVFGRNWALLGFGKDVPEPGDVCPISFVGHPLLLLRDKDRRVRVFQNVCRHRGMTLISEPTRLKAVIRCPYHSWCYGLDGALRTTPHVAGPGRNTHPDIKREELGLIEVASAMFMDMVFVNLDGTAAPFEVHAARLIERLSDFREQPIYHGGAGSSSKLDVATNWKLAVENYCESYHLPWVHPGLNSYSRLEDHYNMVEPGVFSGQGSTAYDPPPGPGGARLPTFDGLAEKWLTGTAEYPSFFPNALIGVHKDHLFVMMIEPLDHQRTREHVEIYYASPDLQAPERRELRERHLAQWMEVFAEDVFVVEGMQRGRHAPGFDGGKFSPVMDAPTHAFHAWVAQQMAT